MKYTVANAPVAQLSGRHLLGIEGLAVPEIQSLLSRSNYFADVITGKIKDEGIADILRGISVVNLFFENSTRTRVSFEVAAKHLGASILNLSASGSSVKKGETLIDTAVTLNAMHPDILVVRHRHAGTPLLLSKHVDALAIVVRAARDQRGMVARMIRQLDGSNAVMLGIVLNAVRPNVGGYFKENYKAFRKYRKGGNGSLDMDRDFDVEDDDVVQAKKSDSRFDSLQDDDDDKDDNLGLPK